MVHHVEGASQLGAHALRNLTRRQRLLGAAPAVRKEAGQRALDRIAGVERRIREGGADLRVAGAVIEVPVGVEDRGDRSVALARISEQGGGVLRVAAGIDENHPLRRVEEDGVAVGPLAALRVDLPGDQVPTRRGGLGRRAGAEAEQDGEHEDEVTHGGFPPESVPAPV